MRLVFSFGIVTFRFIAFIYLLEHRTFFCFCSRCGYRHGPKTGPQSTKTLLLLPLHPFRKPRVRWKHSDHQPYGARFRVRLGRRQELNLRQVPYENYYRSSTADLRDAGHLRHGAYHWLKCCAYGNVGVLVQARVVPADSV